MIISNIASLQIIKSHDKDNGFNDVDLMLFDKVICFDHFKQKLILIVNIGTNDLQKNYKKGIERIRMNVDLYY